MRQTYGDLHQRDKQTRFAHQPGDDQEHAHLLKQQQHQIKLVHTHKPHTLKTRNIHCCGLLSLKHPKKAQNRVRYHTFFRDTRILRIICSKINQSFLVPQSGSTVKLGTRKPGGKYGALHDR